MEKIIIYGASGLGKKVLYSLDYRKYKIVALIDDSKLLWDKYLYGIKVDKTEEVIKYDYDKIIITYKDYSEKMMGKLLALGVPTEKISIYDISNDAIIYDELRIATLRVCIEEIIARNVNGNIAEVGVYQGGFACYLNQYLPDRTLYLFDTFEGFSERDYTSYDPEEGNYSQFRDTNVELVLSKMTNVEKCIVKKGYFPNTAHDVSDEFCFVSLDADLYKPIKTGLEFFYPRLASGGYIFVHDYGNCGWDGVKKAVREFCDENQISFVPLLDRCLSVIITK